jgi:ribosomal protein L11 methyltransferase
MEWFQIQVLVSDESLKEAISSYFFDLGATGVSETIDKGISEGIVACFPKDQQAQIQDQVSVYLNSLKEIFPGTRDVKVTFLDLSQDNWAEKYKEFYKAQKLTNRFFLRPKWDASTPIPKDMFSIFLDPGQAFGTGLHPSTRLSMKLIEDTADLHPSLSGLRLLDVGTGTGILSIVAHKLGFGYVEAIDNDEDAVRVALENIQENESQQVQVSSKDISVLKPDFDVIVSNILLETHRELRIHYGRLLKPGGILILAGLLGGQTREIIELLAEQKFVLQQKYFYQDWAALSFTHWHS